MNELLHKILDVLERHVSLQELQKLRVMVDEATGAVKDVQEVADAVVPPAPVAPGAAPVTEPPKTDGAAKA